MIRHDLCRLGTTSKVSLWQWLSGCDWCKTCVSLPLCTTWVTSVMAGFPSRQTALHKKLRRSCYLPGLQIEGFCARRNLLRYFLRDANGQKGFPRSCKETPLQFSLFLCSKFWLFFVCLLSVKVESFAQLFLHLRMNGSDFRYWFLSLPSFSKVQLNVMNWMCQNLVSKPFGLSKLNVAENLKMRLPSP